MKIIFVRHGHPDYSKDCLTELGHPQAEAAAERLKNEKIDRIFSSSCGRAVETAQHIATRHNLEITQLDFMREISWGTPDTEDFVHPWSLSDGWVKNGIDLMNFDWQNTSDYSERTVVKSYNDLAASFDKWLSEFGIIREDKYYRINKNCDKTILLTSHGGSSSVVISHLFNLPFPFVCRAICPDFTAITVVNLSGKEGELASPRFELVNDSRHIKDITAQNYYGR